MSRRRSLLLLAVLCTAGCPADDDGSISPFAEFTELCASQVDRSSCEATELFEGMHPEPESAACLWEASVPVALEPNGACVFGQPTGRCLVATASTGGCPSPGVQCATTQQGGQVRGGVRSGDDGPVLVEGNVCVVHEDAVMCSVDEDGNVGDEAPAECACFCDPAWPN